MSCFVLFYLHFVSFSDRVIFFLCLTLSFTNSPGPFRLKEFTLSCDWSQCTLLLEGHMGELFSSLGQLVELSHAKVMVEQPLCFENRNQWVLHIPAFFSRLHEVGDDEAHRQLKSVRAPSGLCPPPILYCLQNFETLSVWSSEAWPPDVNSSVVYL